MREVLFLRSPVGVLGIHAAATGLQQLYYAAKVPASARRTPATPIEEQALRELERYFDSPDQPFEVPLQPLGETDFRRHVWRALRTIAPGKTVTYGGLARCLDTAPRAVGGACRANPLPIIIPCHRVLSPSGELRGYCGHDRGRALGVKAWLLQHEKGETP